ncbi:MAG: hypothetical protein JWO91_3351 [Acidobacteriaceae bacterium]|nr:hypothetical protein [Acidobacteriaceae bacterium]
MDQPLDDRIKELCAKAIALPDSPELNDVLKQLNCALSQHVSRLREMASDIVPGRPKREPPTEH